MGDLLKVVGGVAGGAIGGPAGAAIGAGLGGLLAGGGAEGQAQQNAAQQANQGFTYLSNSPLGTSYLPNGGAANSQVAALLGIGGGSGGAATGGQAPGVAAAMGTQLQNRGGASPGALLGGLALGGLGKTNNSPLQDIRQALQLGRPVSDASWAQAGFGPSGAAPGGTPAAGGGGAVGGDAQNAFGKYLDSTGYQFQLGQGQKAITTSNAAKGLLNSGATLKALNNYGQGMAGNYFNNYLGQVNNVAQQGLTAGAAIGGAASQGGANAAQYTANAGNAAASNTAGGLQAVGSLFTPNAAGQSPAGGIGNFLGRYL